MMFFFCGHPLIELTYSQDREGGQHIIVYFTMGETKHNIATENEKDINKKNFTRFGLKGDIRTYHKTTSNPLRTGQRNI